jgi:hypothetical protein
MSMMAWRMLCCLALFGSLAVPTATAYHDDHQYREDRYEREYRDRRSRSRLPDRFTIAIHGRQAGRPAGRVRPAAAPRAMAAGQL